MFMSPMNWQYWCVMIHVALNGKETHAHSLYLLSLVCCSVYCSEPHGIASSIWILILVKVEFIIFFHTSFYSKEAVSSLR